jgi:hypothetical protein
VASLSFTAGRNCKEKEYFCAKSNVYEKVITEITTRNRDPNKQIDPRDINAAYMDAFAAVNDYI